MKITIIVCYDQTSYVRMRTLKAALAATSGVEINVVANSQTGILRYPEVFIKLLRNRWTNHPDAYLVTFRGYEVLLFMVLTFFRQPILFDELINFTEWMEEHHIIKQGTLGYRLFRAWNAWVVQHCRIVLADTEAHADYSAELNRIDRSRYCTIPVSTDETLFFPQPVEKTPDQPFTVFYYGSMLPLHGLKYVLDAALRLKDNAAIKFYFVGGGDKIQAACQAAAQAGAHVTHETWLPFEQIPDVARAAGLTLGGPFGNTLQSQFVITGKAYQFLALGAPVLVGTNLESTIFEDRVNSLVVPQADSEAIAKAIDWAWQHPDELSRIAQAGRHLYEQRFSQAIVNEKVAALVKQIQD